MLSLTITLTLIVQVLRAKRGAVLTISVAPLAHFGVYCAASMLLVATPVEVEHPIAACATAALGATIFMTKMRLSATTLTPWPSAHIDACPFLTFAFLQGVAGWPLSGHALGVVFLWETMALVMLWRDSITRLCAALGVPFWLRSSPRMCVGIGGTEQRALRVNGRGHARRLPMYPR
eukprot:NODE_9565_length_1414_cov_5.282051.p3 GENE.NODE_9565_length_1414_cov_5.282051~~NODE_9565_length_1414_cov_5.282051.p3  ORF type:complete len:177 (-),score=26.62 NODE_9565_length_1414_cov_5.282051:140-670(-)